MVMQAQLQAAVAMAQQHPEQHRQHQQESIFLQQQLRGDQLQRWGSLTSVTSTSSSDWNDIGLPPPAPLRQRSMSSPADAPVPLPAALHQQQQQQYLLACSMPEQQYLLEQQHSLQTCLSMGDSGSLEALVYEAGPRHPGSCMPAADQDAQMLDGDCSAAQPAWGPVSPSVLATAAAFARARHSQQALSTLHSSGSMSSTSSGGSSSSFSQPLATPSSGRSERSASYPGGGSSSCCTVAMELCNSSERSLPRMDSSLLRCQSVAASPKHPEAARLSAQELIMLSKLKAILAEREQLVSIEKQIRHKLHDEQVSRAAAAAAGSSPRAAAAAAAMKQASSLLHQQQRSHSFSGCSLQSPQARALQPSPSMSLPAGAVAAAAASAGGGGGSPHSSRHQHSSTAAALLAAAADPAQVLEYARAHKQQQQQHQACMAAVAAATTAGSPRACPQSAGQQKHVGRNQGLNPAAMAKLRQLMALQQQQIQVQQVRQTGGSARICLLDAHPCLATSHGAVGCAPVHCRIIDPFCLWLLLCALQELLALL